MLNNITYTISCSDLFSVVAHSAEQYAVLTMTGHNYGYASASVVVFQHTDDPTIHNEILRLDDLNKDQITHLLSLDCPDAFIAYALTLCPLSPENSTPNNRRLVCTGKELMGGNLLRPARSYPKKQDITYLEALKDIKAQIEFLNKCSFDKSILSSDEHYALLAIEEELQRLIHFDPIRPADDGLPLRYDHFNCFALPDNLE